jgi:hypothetical protein
MYEELEKICDKRNRTSDVLEFLVIRSDSRVWNS